MKPADEIKKGLGYHGWSLCDTDCPYGKFHGTGYDCATVLCADALALIRELEERLDHMNQLRDAAAGRALKLEERVHQLEAERDAAVEDMTEMAQYVSDDVCTWCDQCECKCGCIGTGANSGFNWRGLQKEESDAVPS